MSDGRDAMATCLRGNAREIFRIDVDQEQVGAFVARGGTAKLKNLRARPHAAVVFRVGWQWAAVEGPVALAGPDDRLEGVEAAGIPGLLREVFLAAGGTHDNWAEYDRVMAEERRTAVFVAVDRVYSNRG